MAFNFENLKVWQKSIKLTGSVNKLISSFPIEERYVLSSQIQRAADSIALNIAEGSTGQSKKEFNRFLGIALRSGIEVISCLYVGKERNLIKEPVFQEYYDKTEELIIMIQALRKSLKENRNDKK